MKPDFSSSSSKSALLLDEPSSSPSASSSSSLESMSLSGRLIAFQASSSLLMQQFTAIGLSTLLFSKRLWLLDYLRIFEKRLSDSIKSTRSIDFLTRCSCSNFASLSSLLFYMMSSAMSCSFCASADLVLYQEQKSSNISSEEWSRGATVFVSRRLSVLVWLPWPCTQSLSFRSSSGLTKGQAASSIWKVGLYSQFSRSKDISWLSSAMQLSVPRCIRLEVLACKGTFDFYWDFLDEIMSLSSISILLINLSQFLALSQLLMLIAFETLISAYLPIFQLSSPTSFDIFLTLPPPFTFLTLYLYVVLECLTILVSTIFSPASLSSSSSYFTSSF